jgi:hypothetical protein
VAQAQGEHVVPIQPLLLHLCIDRDLCTGISKAFSAVAQSAAAGAAVDAQALLRMCYPLVAPDAAARIARAPLSQRQIAAAVAAAAVAQQAVAAAASRAAEAPASASGGRKASAPGSLAAAAAASEAQLATLPPIKATQLMHGAACERVVALLLHRYKLKDVYIAAWL